VTGWNSQGGRRWLIWSAGLAVLVMLLAGMLLVPRSRPGASVPPPPTTEPDDLEWARELERENSTGHESAEGVAATGSGFSVVGHTNSRRPGVEQAWVLRFDQAPALRWERILGREALGTGTLGRAIAALPGGGLVAAGEEQVAVGVFRGWLLALSAEGEVLWERTPGQEGVNGFNAVSVHEDGSIVAGGVQDAVGWVVRMDARGGQLWSVKLPRLEAVTALVALPGQRTAVVGKAETSTVGLGISRLFLLEADGRVSRETQLPARGQGELNALARMRDGGLVAAGSASRPDSTERHLWAVRLDSRGEVLWQQLLDGTEPEQGSALTPLPDGGIAVVGFSSTEQAGHEARVWRISADGKLLWQRSYGGAGEDLGYGIARLEDGNLVVVGSTTSKGAGKTDVWTFGLSPEGQMLWERTFGAP